MCRALTVFLLCTLLLIRPDTGTAQETDSPAGGSGSAENPFPEEELLIPDTEQNAEPDSNTEDNSPSESTDRQKHPKSMTQGNFITYGGIIIGAGSAGIEYNDWIGTSEQNISSSGYYVNPLLCMVILIPPFCGQTEAGVSFGSQKNEKTSVTATRLAGKLKYLHSFGGSFSFGGGLGAYCEIPPASKKYDGAGIILHSGGIYKISRNWLIIADIEYCNGYFGMGHDSTKNSFGLSAGVLTRLGNL